MTYNALNLEDVVYRAGPAVGLYLNFYRSVPREATTVTTGGGAVDFTNQGANFTSGGTSGDKSVLKGGRIRRSGSFQREVLLVTGELENPDGITSDVHIGGFDGDIGSAGDFEAYFDLQNAEWVVGGTTAPAPELTGSTGIAIQFDIDYANNETTCKMTGSDSDTTVINDTPTARISETIAAMESNGDGGENIHIEHASKVSVLDIV